MLPEDTRDKLWTRIAEMTDRMLKASDVPVESRNALKAFATIALADALSALTDAQFSMLEDDEEADADGGKERQ